MARSAVSHCGIRITPDQLHFILKVPEMNTINFENNFYNIPALLVSGSSVVSIFIAIIISVIIIAPPGMV